MRVSWVACRQLAACESFQTICEYSPKILFMNTSVWLDKIVKLVIRFLSKIYMCINFYGSWWQLYWFGIWHAIICHEARERFVQEKNSRVLVYVYISRNSGWLILSYICWKLAFYLVCCSIVVKLLLFNYDLKL